MPPRTLHGVGNESDGAPGKAEGFVGERRSRKVSELSPFRRKRGIRRRRRRCRGGCPQPPGRRTWSGPGGVCWTVRRAAEDGGPYGDRVHFRCRGGYHPPGVLSSAPSSVSLRSTASPLRGEACKMCSPSLPPTGGKVAIRGPQRDPAPAVTLGRGRAAERMNFRRPGGNE